VKGTHYSTRGAFEIPGIKASNVIMSLTLEEDYYAGREPTVETLVSADEATLLRIANLPYLSVLGDPSLPTATRDRVLFYRGEFSSLSAGAKTAVGSVVPRAYLLDWQDMIPSLSLSQDDVEMHSDFQHHMSVDEIEELESEQQQAPLQTSMHNDVDNSFNAAPDVNTSVTRSAQDGSAMATSPDVNESARSWIGSASKNAQPPAGTPKLAPSPWSRMPARATPSSSVKPSVAMATPSPFVQRMSSSAVKQPLQSPTFAASPARLFAPSPAPAAKSPTNPLGSPAPLPRATPQSAVRKSASPAAVYLTPAQPSAPQVRPEAESQPPSLPSASSSTSPAITAVEKPMTVAAPALEQPVDPSFSSTALLEELPQIQGVRKATRRRPVLAYKLASPPSQARPQQAVPLPSAGLPDSDTSKLDTASSPKMVVSTASVLSPQSYGSPFVTENMSQALLEVNILTPGSGVKTYRKTPARRPLTRLQARLAGSHPS
jgi:hypothetical protein